MKIKDLTQRDVIHCPTEHEAKLICKEFDKLGKKWVTGKNYLIDSRWRTYKENICYTIDGCLASLDYCNINNYNIIPFSEIELEYTLPEKWYLPTTGFDYNTLESLNNWRKDQPYCTLKDRGLYDCVLLSKHHNDNSYYQKGAFSFNKYHYYRDYKEITLDQFKNVYPEYFKENQITNQTMKNLIFKLQLNDAQSIIKIACKSDWQPKLIKLWNEDLLLKGEVEITEEFYHAMIKASNSDQITLLNSIFKNFFNKEINLTDLNTIGDRLLFKEAGSESMIAIRQNGNYEYKSFHLNENFNWEIKIDDCNKICLIPTKK